MMGKIIQKAANWVVVKQASETKICNFTNNYYGDQQCYVVKTHASKKALSAPSYR
ncbi:hypothetical protein ACOI22_06980 [Glaciecola sp. 2405UD65-10]|uniref:hypothetical protein n=1 Tax=Glaciecola sp. 2405UD65-10 TaxID=3397244 RepID=UPI003B5B907C